jgi:hypothetical protein
VQPDGTVVQLDVRPGGPELAAGHLQEISRSFGPTGARQTIDGLQATRGNQFVSQVLTRVRDSGGDLHGLGHRGPVGPVPRSLANDEGDPDAPGSVLSRDPARSGGRIQRVISFTTGTTSADFTTNPVVANANAAGFRFGSAEPAFQWDPEVTIHGDAGDVFADWQVAHHQVVKNLSRNVHWGTGADHTHRHWFITGALPQRDATAAGNTWYSDWRAQGFAADGDRATPRFRDTPSLQREPWDNPVAPRAGNSGWFNEGIGFVATLSARHIPDGTGAAAFRHLRHVHWNYGIGGNFDAGRVGADRVRITTGGAINHGGPFGGADPANRPIHGGGVALDNLDHTDT